MYRVKGADQKEYGPITSEQVRQWISENRLNRFSLASDDASPGWKPLGQFAEFAEALGIQPTPSPLGTPAGMSQSPPPAPMYTPQQPQSPPQPTYVPDASVGAYYSPASREIALDSIRGPAIALIVLGIIGILMSVVGIFSNMFFDPSTFRFPDMGNARSDQFMKVWMGMSKSIGIASSLIGIPWNIFVLVGGLKMKKLESHTLCIVAAIFAIIPCFSPCCLVGMPLGIWALVVLNRPDVRSFFAD